MVLAQLFREAVFPSSNTDNLTTSNFIKMSPKRQNPDASNVYRDSESTSTLPLNPSKRPKVAGRPPLGNKDANPSSGGPKSAGLASDAQSYEDIQKRAFNKKETDAIDGAGCIKNRTCRKRPALKTSRRTSKKGCQ